MGFVETSIDEDKRLVDLPGYGYAKVAESVKLRWQETLHRYLMIGPNFKLFCLLAALEFVGFIKRVGHNWRWRATIYGHSTK